MPEWLGVLESAGTLVLQGLMALLSVLGGVLGFFLHKIIKKVELAHDALLTVSSKLDGLDRRVVDLGTKQDRTTERVHQLEIKVAILDREISRKQ